jgi:hypothetical protein
MHTSGAFQIYCSRVPQALRVRGRALTASDAVTVRLTEFLVDLVDAFENGFAGDQLRFTHVQRLERLKRPVVVLKPPTLIETLYNAVRVRFQYRLRPCYVHIAQQQSPSKVPHSSEQRCRKRDAEYWMARPLRPAIDLIGSPTRCKQRASSSSRRPVWQKVKA